MNETKEQRKKFKIVTNYEVAQLDAQFQGKRHTCVIQKLIHPHNKFVFWKADDTSIQILHAST